MHSPRTHVKTDASVALGWALALSLLVPGCDPAHAKPAIDSADPLHAGMATMPPPQLGLPPDPMGDHKAKVETFAVPPPPLSTEFWPCSSCHDNTEPVNKTRRVLTEEHKNIVLHDHDEDHRWCLDCHDAENRDFLHLAAGVTITFDESYKLCGQCHGPQARDWRSGVHGKRTGMWDGEKKYLLCVHCHNPHSPHFKPLHPEPAPERPENVR